MRNNNFEKDRANFLDEAEMLLRQDELPEAFDLAVTRLRSFPGDADAYIVVGNALIGMGRVDESREILQEVGEIIAGLSLIYDRIGDIYREKGYYQDAAICYEKFIALHPNPAKAREAIEKISFLEQENHPVTAVDMISDQSIPEPELFTVTLAELYIKQGHFQEAAKILREIRRRDPQNVQAWTKLEALNAPSNPDSSVSTEFVAPNKLIKTLSSWLKNIDRLKTHVAEK